MHQAVLTLSTVKSDSDSLINGGGVAVKIVMNDVTMKFNDVTAVDQLSVAFEPGNLISLLGPSGCGKSTTLFLLAGLHQPTSGEIYFGNQLMNQVRPEHRGIGMVFQNYALYPHMTVQENIEFPLKIKKVPEKERTRRAVEMAALVKMGDLLSRKPRQLSGGQQQRVAIARALAGSPKLLLLDEPLSNLDARLRLETREEIRRIQRETGVTTIFVTHDQEEAMSISDKILIMNTGHQQQFCPPQEMYEKPVNTFVAAFLGNPPINLMAAAFSGSTTPGLQLHTMSQPVPLENTFKASIKEGEECLAGIRPEDWFVTSEPAHIAFTGKVIHKETIGRDTLIRIERDGVFVRALIQPQMAIRLGETISLGVHAGKMKLFEKTTGKAYT